MIIYDYSKLLGRITEKYGKRGSFAKAVNLSERSLSLKLNNKVQFKQSEINLFIDKLGLSVDDIPVYFFTQFVQSA